MGYGLSQEEKILKEILIKGGDLRALINEKGWTKNQLDIYLKSLLIKESFSIKTTSEDSLKIMTVKYLKKVQPWRWRKDKKKSVEKALESFLPQELRKIFLILLEKEISEVREVLRFLPGRSLVGLFKVAKKGLEELENLFQKQKFAQSFLEKKFREKEAKFPSVILSVKSAGPNKPHLVQMTFRKRRIRAYLKKNFPLGSKVVISPKGFEKFYGRIFQITSKENQNLLGESDERIVKIIKPREFSLVKFNDSQIQRRALGRFLSGEEVFPSSFIHTYKRETRFSFYIKKKKKTISLNPYCKDNQKVMVIPRRSEEGNFLEFYSFSEKKELLKRYQMDQKPPYLTLLYRAQK